MKVAVVGGSGRVGKRIVKLLLERGHEVKTFNRRGERSKMMNPGIVTAISGNYVDLPALTEFVRAMDVMVIATNHVRTNPEWFVPGSRNIMKACKAAGTKRVMFVGNHCTMTHQGRPIQHMFAAPPVFSTFVPLHVEVFKQIRANEEDLDWTVITAAAKMLPYGTITDSYVENTSDELFLPDPKVGMASSTISMEDYANFFVKELEHPRFLRQRVAICNPLSMDLTYGRGES
jgi:putative NADH-flavin reductase